MIRPANSNDAAAIAAIDKTSFSGNNGGDSAERWVKLNFAQDAKYRYFVSEENGAINGYVGWEIKGGFMRKIPVMELQRLAVAESARGKGVGTALIAESIEPIKSWIKQINPEAQTIRMFLWTKKDNDPALKLYGKFFDKTAGERNIYGSDEVMLLAEHTL